jgi:hypothetical protein
MEGQGWRPRWESLGKRQGGCKDSKSSNLDTGATKNFFFGQSYLLLGDRWPGWMAGHVTDINPVRQRNQENFMQAGRAKASPSPLS